MDRDNMTPHPPTARAHAVDQLLRKSPAAVGLATFIDHRREARRYWSEIAAELEQLTGHAITGESLRRWAQTMANDEVAA